jgi:hypothetical protein
VSECKPSAGLREEKRSRGQREECDARLPFPFFRECVNAAAQAGAESIREAIILNASWGHKTKTAHPYF